MRNLEKERKWNKKDFTLENIKKILFLIGNPEKNLKILHIAGTKGKTSVCYYLAHLFHSAGIFKTGLYISPHIERETERIQIDFQEISKEELADLSQKIQNIAQENNITLTYFELLTACALEYFQKKNCEWIILETGLGGRLDATNCVKPFASLITRIDKDHTQILGNNLFKIAYEKMGIVKKNCPFFIMPQKKQIELFCHFYGKWIKKGKAVKLPPFSWKEINPNYYQISINKNLSVFFQGPFYGLKNFIFALSCFYALGFQISNGSSYFHRIGGRFEIYPNGNGVIVIDGAHNPLATQVLADSLEKYFGKQKWIFIFAAFPDKDFKNMLLSLKNIAEKFILLEEKDFAYQECKAFLEEKEIVYEVLKTENIVWKKDSFYCVTGSFYIPREKILKTISSFV